MTTSRDKYGQYTCRHHKFSVNGDGMKTQTVRPTEKRDCFIRLICISSHALAYISQDLLGVRCKHAMTNLSMMTSSNGNIFRVTGHLCGEFTGEFPAQRPVTRGFDVFFDLCPNKRLSKQWWGWWFETPSWSLWCHRNGLAHNFGRIWRYCTSRSLVRYILPSVGSMTYLPLFRVRSWNNG